MPVYGAYYPTIVTEIVRGANYATWGNPNNVKALDGIAAYTALSQYKISNYLSCSGYNISIPDNEVVVGIRCDITGKGIKALEWQQVVLQQVRDETVKLLINGNIVGDNLWIDIDWPDVFETRQYGINPI